ncbi:MAG: CjrA protein-like protein [Ramlibacter sp.]|nr:CjrA protein-like protein [Ramlibacter sp.]
MDLRFPAIVLLLLAACTAPDTMPGIDARVAALLPADAILLGEQHDAPGHQVMHRQAIDALISRGLLAAVALEMVEQGRSTAGLPRDASETAVKAALGWDDAGWPWTAYGPAVMAAVRAGVPVLGANLPRSQLRAAMADAGLDALLPATALEAQRQAVRAGHCDLLPESQIAPMARVQIARDRAMAQALAQAAAPRMTVVLLAGSGHVDAELGVPQHLPASLRARSQSWPAQPSGEDYCARLRDQLKARAAP